MQRDPRAVQIVLGLTLGKPFRGALARRLGAGLVDLFVMLRRFGEEDGLVLLHVHKAAAGGKVYHVYPPGYTGSTALPQRLIVFRHVMIVE